MKVATPPPPLFGMPPWPTQSTIISGFNLNPEYAYIFGGLPSLVFIPILGIAVAGGIPRIGTREHFSMTCPYSTSV